MTRPRLEHSDAPTSGTLSRTTTNTRFQRQTAFIFHSDKETQNKERMDPPAFYYQIQNKNEDEKERTIIRKVEAEAMKTYLTWTYKDSTEWFTKVIDAGFDVTSSDSFHGLPILEYAVASNKPKITRLLLEKGAKFKHGINEENEAGNEARVFFIEKMFASIVAGGLCDQSQIGGMSLRKGVYHARFSCRTEFGMFLCKGLYDARLLIEIMKFVHDCNWKRK